MNPEDIRANYRDLLGQVPDNIEKRLALAEAADRTDAIAAIETWREELLHRNALDRRTQQLVHFALLIGSGEENPARLHATGALKAGATVRELFGVAETAAITGACLPSAVQSISSPTPSMKQKYDFPGFEPG